MNHTVLLDTGPLGLVTNPRRCPQSVACAQWLQALVRHGSRVLVPEIADKALDRDVILAVQAMTLGTTDIAIATTNVGHLSRFAPAALWPDITATS